LGTTEVGYQWYKDSVAISGANSAMLEIANAQESEVGIYTLEIINASGSDVSSPVILYVLGEPEMLNQTAGAIVGAGNSRTLVAEAIGAAPLTVQWYLNDIAISGATEAMYKIEAAVEADAGMYHAVITNGLGTVSSRKVAVSVEFRGEGIDTDFTPPLVGGFYGIYRDEEGNYVVVGSFNQSSKRNLMVIDGDGNLDSSVTAGGYPSAGFNNRNFVFDSKGRIIYANNSTLYRLNAGDYSLDTTFNSNASGLVSSLSNLRMAVDGDDKILISRWHKRHDLQ
jgi:hypothetical protein